MLIDVKFSLETKKQCGLQPHEVGAVTSEGLLAARSYPKKGPQQTRTIQGWFAVSVPGTILCPWDADFSRIYASQDKQEIDALKSAVDMHNEGARRAISLLAGREVQYCHVFPDVTVNQCSACSNGTHEK